MDRQKEAIKTISMNLAVTAGAGTGKTKVLTERYVHILENGNLQDGKEIESLVAITFTKKASTEMKERIEQEIAKHLHKGERWERFYRDFSKAYIMTIHSFCGKLLRENPVEADIDPGFQVLEEYVADRMLKESARTVLNEVLKDEHNLQSIAQTVKKDSGLLVRELIDLYKKIRTLGISMDEAIEITASHMESMEADRDILDEIRELAVYLRGEMGKGKFINILKEPLPESFLEDHCPDEMLEEALQMLLDNMGSSKKAPEAQARIRELLLLALSVYEKEKLQLYRLILQIVREIHLDYSHGKAKQRSLDYEDLQIKAYELLQSEDILERYQDRFKYIMIDEFQDTNLLQKNIFYRLASRDDKLDRGNLFVVGDPKQSIYAFRGADIQVFYDVMDDIKSSDNGKVITLTENYRNVSTVLKLVDKIFHGLMGTRYDSLNPNKKVDEPMEVEILHDKDFEGSSEESQQFEADQIARRIRYMVDNEYLHNKKKIRFGDIALLFRALTRSSIYEEALRRYNIPYSSTGGKGFYDREEILDIVNALKATSNPEDTISMVGFLRGGFAGLSDEAIFHILNGLQNKKEEGILDIMEQIIKNRNKELDGHDYSTMESTWKMLRSVFFLKNHLGIVEILKLLMEESAFYKSQLLQYQGLMRSENIDRFLLIAGEFEATEGGSLEEFIDYIENRREESDGDGVQATGGDSVSLMSIHKSKGLQFPVVIIPEMGRKGTSDSAAFQFHKDKGLGIKNGNGSYYEMIYKDAKENLQEEVKRLIYVAMTRAEERLVLGYQGRKSGFKALVDEYLHNTTAKVVCNFPVEPEEAIMVKTIEDAEAIGNDKSYPLLEFIQQPIRGREAYSISQYTRFLSCPREYFLRYKARLDIEDGEDSVEASEIKLSGATKGTLVHEFCRSYKRGDNIIDLLHHISSRQGVKLTEDIEMDLMPLIDNFKRYSEETSYPDVEVEKEFYIPLGNHIVTGFIDRLEILHGHKRVIDIKTNRISNKDELLETYKPQLIFYRWAAGKILNSGDISAAILFLEDGSLVDIQISRDEEKLLLEDMERTFNFVENHHQLEDYQQSKECSHNCRFKLFCKREDA